MSHNPQITELRRRRLLKGFLLAPVVAAAAQMGVIHREHFGEQSPRPTCGRDDGPWVPVEVGFQTMIALRSGIPEEMIAFSIDLSRLRLDTDISEPPWANVSESDDGRAIKVTYVWDGGARTEAERDTAVAKLTARINEAAARHFPELESLPRAQALNDGEEFDNPTVFL